ncbi:MAG: DUF1826 domain-containing protein [Rhodospirillales bacterium]
MTVSTIASTAEARRPSAQPSSGVEHCETIAGLQAISQPQVQLVIWRRRLTLCLRRWLDRLDPATLPRLRLLLRPTDCRREIQPLLDEAGLPAGPMRDLLVEDIAALAHAFARIARSDLVDLRLEGIAHDACWKFHRDCVEARLLTTYRGLATEWVHPSQSQKALNEQQDFQGPIERLSTHDVGLFKGSCAQPGSGIVHRSPPIAATGKTRLLLCLNLA